MAKSLKKCWNVYVYDHFTANGNFSARLNSNKWVRWMKYGTLNYTYFMTFDTSIYNSSSIGAQNPITGQSFGKDVQ
jgi:intracellular septation protein A